MAEVYDKMLKEGGTPSLEPIRSLWYGGELYSEDVFFDQIFTGGAEDDEETLVNAEEASEHVENAQVEDVIESQVEDDEETSDQIEDAADNDEEILSNTDDVPKSPEKNEIDSICDECDSKSDGMELTDFLKTARTPKSPKSKSPKSKSHKSKSPADKFKKELAMKAAKIQGGSKRKDNVEQCSEEVSKAIRNFSMNLKL